jgi:hypothetical protein
MVNYDADPYLGLEHDFFDLSGLLIRCCYGIVRNFMTA